MSISDASLRKVPPFVFEGNSRKFKSKVIKNQQSLLGTIFKVMTNESLVIALIKVESSDQTERSIPLNFKVNHGEILQDLDLKKVSVKNLISFEIDNFEKFNGLLVASGDDSEDLMKNFKAFCTFAKKNSKIPTIAFKEIQYLNIDCLKIKKCESRDRMTPFDDDKYKSLLTKLAEIKERQSQKYNLRRNRITSQPIIESDDESHDDGAKSHSKAIAKDKGRKKATDPEYVSPKPSSSKTKANTDVDEKEDSKIPKKISILNSLIPKMKSEVIQEFCRTSVILFRLLSAQHLQDDATVRLIPDEDMTTTENEIINLEGILPIYLTKYRKVHAMTPKGSSPACFLSNFVRYAFPPYWIDGVTLRGNGPKNTSLIKIWSYHNPLKKSDRDEFIQGLGEQRLKALIDHAVRKSGKVSYDETVENRLIATIMKALHARRVSRAEPKKSLKKNKPKADSSSSESGWSDLDDRITKRGSKKTTVVTPAESRQKSNNESREKDSDDIFSQPIEEKDDENDPFQDEDLNSDHSVKSVAQDCSISIKRLPSSTIIDKIKKSGPKDKESEKDKDTNKGEEDRQRLPKEKNRLAFLTESESDEDSSADVFADSKCRPITQETPSKQQNKTQVNRCESIPRDSTRVEKLKRTISVTASTSKKSKTDDDVDMYLDTEFDSFFSTAKSLDPWAADNEEKRGKNQQKSVKEIPFTQPMREEGELSD